VTRQYDAIPLTMRDVVEWHDSTRSMLLKTSLATHSH
jgi:hypothetical protein